MAKTLRPWHPVPAGSTVTINMRLRTLLLQDALEVSKFSNFLLRVGEGTEPEDDNQMIHIDNKFVVPGALFTKGLNLRFA